MNYCRYIYFPLLHEREQSLDNDNPGGQEPSNQCRNQKYHTKVPCPGNSNKNCITNMPITSIRDMKG